MEIIEISLTELGWIVMSLKKLSIQDLMNGSNIDESIIDSVCKLLNNLELIYNEGKINSDSVGGYQGLLLSIGQLRRGYNDNR